MKTYIYTLSHPTTGEVRYLGKTINLKRRFYQHTNKNFQLKGRTHISNWLLFLINGGLKPVMTVIDEIDKDWQERECYWIAKLREEGIDLCNITKGGEGTGDYLSKEVSTYDKEGNYIKTYNSAIQCSIDLKCSHPAISACAKGKTRLVKGCQIRYGSSKENVGRVKSKKIRTDSLNVYQFDKEGKLIKRWNSVLEASKVLKIDRRNIKKVLDLNNRSANNYIWKTTNTY